MPCRPCMDSRSSGVTYIILMQCRGKLPRPQQEPDHAKFRAAVQEHTDSGSARSPWRRGSENHDLPDAPAPRALV